MGKKPYKNLKEYYADHPEEEKKALENRLKIHQRLEDAKKESEVSEEILDDSETSVIENTKQLCLFNALIQYYLEYRPLSDEYQKKWEQWLVDVHLGKEIDLVTVC